VNVGCELARWHTSSSSLLIGVLCGRSFIVRIHLSSTEFTGNRGVMASKLSANLPCRPAESMQSLYLSALDYAKMGVAHEWILLYEWVFGDFHFTRIHPWASLFFSVALHITIRHIEFFCSPIKKSPIVKG
jgi:hypothetical protein